MDDLFRKYYLPDDYVINMLGKAIIVFDTSALLDLYYYSEIAQKKIFADVFDYLNERLWVPAQVYFEFLKNKNKVIQKPAQSYQSLITAGKSGNGGHINKIELLAQSFGAEDLKKIQNQMKTLKEQTLSNDKHPYLPEEIYSSLEEAIKDIEQHIVEFQTSIAQFAKDIKGAVDEKVIQLTKTEDTVQSILEDKFQLGVEFSYNEMLEIAKEGAFRYQEQIPPGFEDGNEKVGLQKFGDLFVWKEILTYARENEQDVLLVTNDVKVDWYDAEQKAPRFELLKEFNSMTDHNFWSCNMGEFLYLINKVLDKEHQISEEILEEVSTVQTKRMIISEKTVDYTELLQEWLFTDSDLQITGEIPIDEQWRIFGNIKLYEGINSQGNRCVILLNLIKNPGYARVLHAIQNAFEIKKQFDIKDLKYEYHQFSLTFSVQAAEKMIEHLRKPNLRKYYQRTIVQSNFGYIDNDKRVMIIDANHPLG